MDIDDFGDWGDLDEYVPEEYVDQVVIPKGVHELEIVKAGLIVDPKGVERFEIKLKHPEKGYYLAAANPQRGSEWWTKILGSLAKALGMKGNELRDAVVDGSIIGRTVHTRVWHNEYEGKTYAKVGEFHAVEGETVAKAKEPAKPAAKRAAPRKTVAASSAPKPGVEDDIPF